MNETFLLSNIAPQVGENFNRHCVYLMRQIIPDIILNSLFRLGLLGRLVSTTNQTVRRCIRVYNTSLSAPTGPGWEMACGGLLRLIIEYLVNLCICRPTKLSEILQT
jgi:hypothetical protein